MAGVDVILSPDEMEWGGFLGQLQLDACARRGARERDNIPTGDPFGQLRPGETQLDKCIRGARAMLAVCKRFNLYPTGAIARAVVDCGWVLESRSRPHDNGRLILKADDDPGAVYVLVTGQAPHLALRGYCYGYEFMADELWDDPYGGRPAWWVPIRRLHAVEELLDHFTLPGEVRPGEAYRDA